MCRILLCAFITILFIPVCFSQNVVTGTVKDNGDANVSFATLKFYLKDSAEKSEAEKIADDSGSFTVQLKNKGQYFVIVSAIGYLDTTLNFNVDSSLTYVNVFLKKSDITLAGVVITANTSPPIIVRKIDRIVMNVSDNPLATGKSSLELMNLAPGVFVNDGKISINGNGGTHVMVNGRLLQITGQDLTNYLSNLRAEDIQSVEVIAHPPAQYDAEGTGGLINIILKRNRKTGLSGSLNTAYTRGKYASTSDGISLNFNKKKLTLLGTYSYNRSKSFENTFISRTGKNTFLTTQTNRVNNSPGYQTRLGGTYDINTKQFLGLEYNHSYGSGGFSYNSVTNVIYPNPIQNQKIVGMFPFSHNGSYNNIGFNYHWNTDTAGSEFVFISDYTQNKLTPISGATSTFYDYQNNFLRDTSYKNETPNNGKIFTADVHYKKVFSKTTSFSLGVKLSNTNIDNRAYYQYGKDSGAVENTPQDFKYVYHENIYAGYVNYDGNVLKTDFQIGLRGEYTDLIGTLTQLNNNARNPDDYFSLFPSVFLKKNLNKKEADFFTFNYSRRVERPSFTDLNPYEFYVDNYTIARGNPYLIPSYINSYSLAYTLHNTYTATAFLYQQKNMIGEYILTSPDTLLTIDLRQNFGKRYNYGIEFYVPVKIASWWQMQNDATARYESLAAQFYTIKAPIFEINTTQEFKLPKNFMITVNAFYLSKHISGSFLFKPIYEVNIGLQKKFFHNKFIAKAAANDIFDLREMHATGYYYGGTLDFRSQRQWQTYSLSLIYNFDLGKAFNTHNLERSNVEEKSRL